MTLARLSLALLAASSTAWAAKAPIAITEPSNRTTPVDFDREVRPFLSDNCLSCHCQTTTKGGLNLETPALMLKGGDTGPAIKPKAGADSLILQAAAHLDDDLTMPPRDNKAKAKNLTPEQLGLLKAWIDQGAKDSPKTERVVHWQPLPEGLGTIFAVAMSADGQFAACSRANRVFIYQVGSGRLVATEAAHRDQVNALAFSPDGTLMASGAYREVKLWRKGKIEGQPTAAPVVAAVPDKAPEAPAAPAAPAKAPDKAAKAPDKAPKIARADGLRFMTIDANAVKLTGADGKVIAELRGNRYTRDAADERDRGLQVETGNLAYRKDAMSTADKAVVAAVDRSKKAAEAVPMREQELVAKKKALADATEAKKAPAKALADAEAELKTADAKLQEITAKAAQLATAATEAAKAGAGADTAKATADSTAAQQELTKVRADRDQREAQRKKAADKAEPANKLVTDAETAATKAELAKSAAEAEIPLAKVEEQKTAATATEAKAAVEVAEAAKKKADEALQAAKAAATAAEQPVRVAIFSPDGTTVAVAGDDQLVHTYSADNGAAFDVLAGHKAAVTALAFAPDGKLVSTAADGTALAWNLSPEWKLERTIGTGDTGSPLADRVNALAFSHDGKQLASGGGEPSRGGEIKLWDVATGNLVRDIPKIHSDTVFSLEFSPDGKLIASGAADKMARVTDIATGKLVRTFEGHTHHVLGVSWSADGRTLATAGADGMVKIWDFTTGDRKKNIEGYDKEVTTVRFVAATINLLTSSGDNRVRLVTVDGKEVRAFPEVTDFMQSAAVSADGKVVVAGGQDSVLRVWNAADGVKLATFAPPGKK